MGFKGVIIEFGILIEEKTFGRSLKIKRIISRIRVMVTIIEKKAYIRLIYC